MPLGYLSCFAKVLRGINGNVDVYQTDYSIPSNLEFPLIPEVIQGGKKVQVKGTLMWSENLLTFSSQHKNNIPKVSNYNTFYFLRYARWRYEKC